MKLVGGYYRHHYAYPGPRRRVRIRRIWVWAFCAATGHRLGKREVEVDLKSDSGFKLRRFECLCGSVTVHG